jgi:hypothetical protein
MKKLLSVFTSLVLCAGIASGDFNTGNSWDADGGTIAGDLTVNGDLTPNGRLMLPMGEISYFNTTGTTITIASQSDGSTNMVHATVASSLNSLSADFDNGGANDGSLRYTGTTTRMFHCALTWSIVAATGGDVFVLGMAVNGTPVVSSKVIQTLAGTNVQGSAIHSFVELETNDVLTLYIGNLTAGRNAVIRSINLFAMGM